MPSLSLNPFSGVLWDRREPFKQLWITLSGSYLQEYLNTRIKIQLGTKNNSEIIGAHWKTQKEQPNFRYKLKYSYIFLPQRDLNENKRLLN